MCPKLAIYLKFNNTNNCITRLFSLISTNRPIRRCWMLLQFTAQITFGVSHKSLYDVHICARHTSVHAFLVVCWEGGWCDENLKETSANTFTLINILYVRVEVYSNSALCMQIKASTNYPGFWFPRGVVYARVYKLISGNAWREWIDDLMFSPFASLDFFAASGHIFSSMIFK